MTAPLRATSSRRTLLAALLLCAALATGGCSLTNNNGSCDGTGASNSACNQTVLGASSSAPPVGAAGQPGQNIATAAPPGSAGGSNQPGSQIGAPYKVTVSVNFALTFGPEPAKPVYSVCTADFGLFAGPCAMFGTTYSADKQVSKPAIATPTYHDCVNDTLYVNDPHDMGAPQAGEVFCLLAADGIEVGIVVLDAKSDRSAGTYMTLEIYEWRGDQPS